MTAAAGGSALGRLLAGRPSLHGGQRPWSDEFVDFRVELRHDGLAAVTGVRTIGGDGLVDWLTELAESFRGWSGSRSWRSLDRDLSIHAHA